MNRTPNIEGEYNEHALNFHQLELENHGNDLHKKKVLLGSITINI